MNPPVATDTSNTNLVPVSEPVVALTMYLLNISLTTAHWVATRTTTLPSDPHNYQNLDLMCGSSFRLNTSPPIQSPDSPTTECCVADGAGAGGWRTWFSERNPLLFRIDSVHKFSITYVFN